MSLYNAIAGFNPNAAICMAIMGLHPKDVARFRDAWLSDDGEKITILTRTGGGNRADFMTENFLMTQQAGYVSDRDDTFDSTFAHFVYVVPHHFKKDTLILAHAMKKIGLSEDTQGPEMIVKRVAGELKLTPMTMEEARVAGDAFERILRSTGIPK